jgi:hypothetical protein
MQRKLSDAINRCAQHNYQFSPVEEQGLVLVQL